MLTGRKSAGGKEEEEMALPVKSCRMSKRTWSLECMGTVWSSLACVCVLECLSLCVNKSRQGCICLCDVTTWEAENMGWVFPQCTDETMTQHDSETADKYMRVPHRAPCEGRRKCQIIRTHTHWSSQSFGECNRRGRERFTASYRNRGVEVRVWMLGEEAWHKAEIWVLPPPAIFLSTAEYRSMEKSILFPLCISLCLATCFGSLDESIPLCSDSIANPLL